ncbi:4-amino-4-deoxy-L-arabinose transferase-like glycosyltransferase [Humibacillus xanthopallidus]|uniref:4-amino-4-deoxy-L-arabinose transferase-like glycosyltransferase n=1 Tax=Humibacillus xanthopallidus TaxID=412689 RepID=A0A543PMG2_9MICO|nr:hypothetical protein [Humibacillus xanthopallidus]TQN45247.1 4-amino-4-deoxy-L-arabinose transferase-like glycosyltransferase [Humibacillus xanthopallidus]
MDPNATLEDTAHDSSRQSLLKRDRQVTAGQSTAEGNASTLPRWLRVSLIGVLVVFVAIRVVEPLRDPDSFWHIAAGARLAHTWDFVTTDPWSASSTQPWILNQWLPELAMSAAYRLGGYAAVVWLFIIASVGVLLVVWATCRARSSMLTAAVITMAAFFALSASLSPRPQLASFALAAVTTHAWLRSIDDHRPRWWLIPLTWLWACSHGLWFLSAGIGSAAVLGLWAGRGVRGRDLTRLALVVLGSLSVGALTPVGPRLLASPFQVHEVTQFITEWQPPARTDPHLLVTLALLVLATVGAWRPPRSRRWAHLLLCLMALALALTYVRTIGLAAVIAAPMAAGALHGLTGMARERVARTEILVTTGLVLLALGVAGLTAAVRAQDSGLGPEAMGPALSKLPGGTVVCNDLLYGGWLILEHPDLRPTMDSRFEIYSVDQIEAYRDFISGGSNWRQYVASTGCAYALLKADSPALQVVSGAGWRTEATTKDLVLMARS